MHDMKPFHVKKENFHFVWNMIRFLYVIACAFRRGVAPAGEVFY